MKRRLVSLGSLVGFLFFLSFFGNGVSGCGSSTSSSGTTPTTSENKQMMDTTQGMFSSDTSKNSSVSGLSLSLSDAEDLVLPENRNIDTTVTIGCDNFTGTATAGQSGTLTITLSSGTSTVSSTSCTFGTGADTVTFTGNFTIASSGTGTLATTTLSYLSPGVTVTRGSRTCTLTGSIASTGTLFPSGSLTSNFNVTGTCSGGSSVSVSGTPTYTRASSTAPVLIQGSLSLTLGTTSRTCTFPLPGVNSSTLTNCATLAGYCGLSTSEATAACGS